MEAEGGPSGGLPKQITERGQAGAGLIEELALPGWKPRGPTWCRENVPSAPTQKDSPERLITVGGAGALSHDSEP